MSPHLVPNVTSTPLRSHVISPHLIPHVASALFIPHVTSPHPVSLMSPNLSECLLKSPPPHLCAVPQTRCTWSRLTCASS